MAFTPKDLVFYNNEDGIMAGGFKINTIYDSFSPLKGFEGQKGGSQSLLTGVFSDLAVPAGLFFAQQNIPASRKYETKNYEKSAPDSLHERLLKLVSPKKRLHHNIKTRKQKRKDNSKTRKKLNNSK